MDVDFFKASVRVASQPSISKILDRRTWHAAGLKALHSLRTLRCKTRLGVMTSSGVEIIQSMRSCWQMDLSHWASGHCIDCNVAI